MATEVQRLLAPVMGERERDAAVIALRALLRRGELVDRDADMVRGAVEARDELVLWLGRSPQSVTPRVKELLEAGWLETKLHDDGSAAMRRTRSGADAQVLVLTARARQEMRRRGVRLTAS
jgi:hypothetical protein